jgi:hypothetical protein
MAALNIQLQPGDIQTRMVPSEANPAISLGPGNSLYSPAGAFRLTFQASDGNALLQIVNDNSLPPVDGAPISPEGLDWLPFWETVTADRSASHIQMQVDGNLVVYNPTGPIWASNTAGHFFAFLQMQDDGNLVIYEQNLAPVWATNTSVFGSPGAGGHLTVSGLGLGNRPSAPKVSHAAAHLEPRRTSLAAGADKKSVMPMLRPWW